MPVSWTLKWSRTARLPGCFFELHAHDDLALLGELDGVADEVDENLPQTHGIADQVVGHVGRNVAQQLQTGAMDANAEQLERVDQAVAQAELDRDRA